MFATQTRRHAVSDRRLDAQPIEVYRMSASLLDRGRAQHVSALVGASVTA
jgi:hypothetical protein